MFKAPFEVYQKIAKQVREKRLGMNMRQVIL
jgi:hypothetical protein